MQSVLSLFRLGLGGILLEPQAFRAQRDAPNGLRRGFLLVLLVGLLVGLAALIGNLGEYLAQPSPTAVAQTIADGLRAMPWFAKVAAANPEFPAQFDRSLGQAFQSLSLLNGGGLAGSLAGVIAAPLLLVLGWLIYGLLCHLMARALGGKASLGQTLACVAVASGVNLLGAVQIIPFAQVSGTTLLGLAASYVAIREAHGLPPWRAFWAAVIGPILLMLLLAGLFCLGIVFVLSSIGSAIQGGRSL
jgi:hypothetical protein